jgi:hypothetical protein
MTRFYLYSNCSKQRLFAHSKESAHKNQICSEHMLKKFVHSRNLLTEFACSIEKLLTMKKLAGLDG